MKFTVRERVIKCTNEALIGDNADYIAEFDFDSEWDGVIKTARFENTKNHSYMDVILNSDNTCVIPAEMLKFGYVRIGVFSASMTTTYCEIAVSESIKERSGNHVAPDPDVYTQIIKMIENMEQGEIPEEQIEKAISDYLEIHPIESGITKEQCEQIVYDYVTAHKAELKGDKGDAGYTPLRGADYWTSNDVAEIQTYIDNQIGGALNGSY